jgi:orotate phosphoribosyltransferase
MPILQAAADVDVRGLVVSVDRAERGTGDQSALAEVADTFGFTATAIAHIDDVVAHLRDHDVDGRRVIGPDDLARIAAYRAEWGA